MVKAKPPTVHLDDRALNIFTDGSSYSRPRRGGIGILYVDVDENGQEKTHDYSPPGYQGASNNDMELRACIEALTEAVSRHFPIDISGKSKIVIYTDSQYVASRFQQARFQWPRSHWQTRDGNPVQHAVLWKELIRRADRTEKRVEIIWRKGHSSSNPHNKVADRLAKSSAGNAVRPPLAQVKVRRKKSSKQEERGSVALTGQRMTIRIITDQWLPVQKMFVYKYEVVSQRSQYCGFVDRIFSEHLLSAGHTYSVRVNDDSKRPRITKRFREV